MNGWNMASPAQKEAAPQTPQERNQSSARSTHGRGGGTAFRVTIQKILMCTVSKLDIQRYVNGMIGR